jgi:hypothetical protein
MSALYIYIRKSIQIVKKSQSNLGMKPFSKTGTETGNEKKRFCRSLTQTRKFDYIFFAE